MRLQSYRSTKLTRIFGTRAFSGFTELSLEIDFPYVRRLAAERLGNHRSRLQALAQGFPARMVPKYLYHPTLAPQGKIFQSGDETEGLALQGPLSRRTDGFKFNSQATIRAQR
jgi:hypothetical protein